MLSLDPRTGAVESDQVGSVNTHKRVFTQSTQFCRIPSISREGPAG